MIFLTALNFPQKLENIDFTVLYYFSLLSRRTQRYYYYFFFFRATPAACGSSRVRGLGVESKLQIPAYATATATQDPSHICDLCHSLWQCWILNSLREARNQTCIPMDTSQILNLLSHNRNFLFFFSFL